MGSDVIHYESLEAACKKAGIKYYTSKDKGAGPEAFKSKLRMIRKVEKYVDYIINAPTRAQLLTRGYIKFFVPMDVKNIKYNNTPNSRPVVVHAPTKDQNKGTPYILQAVERLKMEGYDFEFSQLVNIGQNLFLEALTKADIAADRLLGLGPGTFAVESMAAGCAVLSGCYLEFSGLPPEIPIIHTDPDNIYQNLKLLLENSQLRREMGEKGREYVEKYHDSLKVADNFIKLLTTGEAERVYPAKRND